MSTAAAVAPFELKSDTENDSADLVTKALGEFQTAVDDRLKALEEKTANDNALADRLAKVETRLNRPGSAVELKSANDNSEIEKKAFATFLRHGKEALAPTEAKALTVASGPAAGYLVPTTFAAEMLKYLVQFSPVRNYAQKMLVSGSEIVFPRRTSEIAATWVAETGARTAGTTEFEQLTLKPYELQAYVDISNQLLEDNAYDLEGEIALQFAEQFGKTEGAAFVGGTGVGQPTGLLTSTQISSMATGSAGKVTIDDVIAAYHALPSAWAQNAVWMMNRTTLGTLRGLKDTVGRPYLIDPMSAGGATTLLGRPIVEAIDMPSIATGNTPILFGDLGGYRIVDRVGLSTLRDPFSQAANGITRFYARKRVGADVTDGQRFIKLTVA